MANKKNSGLGRGLNALIPTGPMEFEEEPVQTSQEKPVKEPVQKPAAKQSAARPVQKQEPGEFVDGTIEIKGVAYREAKPKEEPVAEIKETDEVSIDLVKPNPDQPRINFKPEELEELAASIEKDGLLQPILVRKMGDGTYQIIAGERRWKACKSIGLKKVPVRIREVDDEKVLELAMIENLQRADLNPIEEAYGYRRLMDRKKLTQSEVAQMLSKGRSTVANALRLLNLPEDAQKLLFEDKISAGHARAILSLENSEDQKKLTDKIVEDNMSVREAESFAKFLANRAKPGEAKPRIPAPSSYKAVAKSLKAKLNTAVKVRSAGGKNKIEIEFKDEEDLKRIFEQLVDAE